MAGKAVIYSQEESDIIQTRTSSALPNSRRTDVLKAAADIIFGQGYDATSMNEIAQAAGITKPGLYYHFESKEDILFSIMCYALDYVDHNIIARCEDIADPYERLRLAITLNIKSIFVEGGPLTISFDYIKNLSPENHRIVRRQLLRYFRFLRQALKELRSGEPVNRERLDLNAVHIMLTMGSIARWHEREAAFDPDVVTEHTVRFLLDGVAQVGGDRGGEAA